MDGSDSLSWSSAYELAFFFPPFKSIVKQCLPWGSTFQHGRTWVKWEILPVFMKHQAKEREWISKDNLVSNLTEEEQIPSVWCFFFPHYIWLCYYFEQPTSTEQAERRVGGLVVAHLVHHLQQTVWTAWSSQAAGDLIRKRSILLWGQGFDFETLHFYCMSLTINITGFFSSLQRANFWF